MVLLYPWFLFGLVSIAIPIAIHFFELRKPQLVRFTNVGFIREANIITARQRKVKHLFILLARVGFISFLVLLFCQPFLPAAKKDAEMGQSVSVLLDTTPSMQTTGANDQSILDQAVREANEVATIYPAGTQFHLSGNPTALAKETFQNATDQLTISGQSETIFNALRSAQTSGRVRKKQVFVFSDFQKNDFSASHLARFDSTQQIFLVPLSGEKTANVYVDSVAIDDAFVRRDTDITLRIRLRNGGSITSTDCQVKLFIGEKQAATYQATVEAGGIVTSSVRVRLTGNDSQRCRVEIEDFPVSFDNVFYFVLQPSAPIRIVDFAFGEPATQKLYGNESLFSYTKSSPQNVSYGMQESANLALIQQPQVDASLRESLKRLVERGGSVVIIPPAAAAGRASYAQLLQDLGVGSVQWEPSSTSAPNKREVATPSAQNPFFREVFAAQNRQTVMPKVAPVLRWSRSETDILRLQDGEGFLASFKSGLGTVYLFSAPFEDSYSDFTSHALFVPVMYRLAMQSFRDDQQLAYRMSQRTVALAVPDDANNAEQVFKLTQDSLTFIPSQRLQAGVLRFDVPPGMKSPGFYQLTLNGRVLKTLAFNIDKRESELASYSADELRGMIGKDYSNVQVYEPSAAQSVATQYRAERVGTPLWHYCLWAALACLLVEVLLLRFMTRHKTREPILAAA